MGRLMTCSAPNRYLTPFREISSGRFIVLGGQLGPFRRQDTFLVLLHNSLAFSFPLVAIVYRIIQVLVGRDPEDAAVLELPGQWNDIKIEKANFALVPELTRIFFGAAIDWYATNRKA